jgi:hypothetical protein
MDRREFLKQGGLVVATPLARTSFAGSESAHGLPRNDSLALPECKLEWIFANGQISINIDGQKMGEALFPGHLTGQVWQLGEKLALEQDHRPYSDRLGPGTIAIISCKIGSLDGELRLINYADGKAACRLDLVNNTASPIVLGKYTPLCTNPQEGALRLDGAPTEWRLYIDSGSCGGNCASFGVNENDGHNVAGAVSVLWSPEGNQAVAIGQVEVERSWTNIEYFFGEKGLLSHEYRWAQAKRLRLCLEQDATGYQIDPGETFQLDQCLLAANADPFRALVAFRDAMVIFNNVRKFTNDDVWVGWSTWYNQPFHLRGGLSTGVEGATRETCASAAVTLEQSKFIVDSGLHAYGIRNIEIDDGYQKNLHLGEWLETTEMFPTGMNGISKDLQVLGMRPGIWLTPFAATEDASVFREHPEWFVKYGSDWYHANVPVKMYDFDPTAPGALAWLINVFRTFQRWGYSFYKNDFSGSLFYSEGKQYYNRKQTGLMRWRWAWRKIKEALGGDGACSLQLCGVNNIGAIGIIDSVRVCNDIVPQVGVVQWKIIREDVAMTGINRWWQNKHFFIADPDNFEVAEYKDYRVYQDVLDFEHKWALSFDEARFRAALVVAVGGNIMLGDRLTLLEPERIAIIKKTLPLYGESAIPLDMFEQTLPSLWWHHISRPWDSWDVLSVANYGEASLVKEIPLSKIGISADQKVIVWELWGESEHTNITDGIIRVAVKPHSVKTLRITSVDKGKSALVGSSFHITMGAVEIQEASYGKKGSVQVKLSRPVPEGGVCAFWSAAKGAVVTVPVQVGPKGITLTME